MWPRCFKRIQFTGGQFLRRGIHAVTDSQEFTSQFGQALYLGSSSWSATSVRSYRFWAGELNDDRIPTCRWKFDRPWKTYGFSKAYFIGPMTVGFFGTSAGVDFYSTGIKPRASLSIVHASTLLEYKRLRNSTGMCPFINEQWRTEFHLGKCLIVATPLPPVHWRYQTLFPLSASWRLEIVHASMAWNCAIPMGVVPNMIANVMRSCRRQVKRIYGISLGVLTLVTTLAFHHNGLQNSTIFPLIRRDETGYSTPRINDPRRCRPVFPYSISSGSSYISPRNSSDYRCVYILEYRRWVWRFLGREVE